MAIDLTTFWGEWNVVSGNTQATNQYEFWNGMVMTNGQVLSSQYDFFKYHNTTRYEWFKNLQSTYPEVYDETTFYKNTSDERIYDYSTFYQYGGQYLVPSSITPTPTPTFTPTPTPTFTPTPTLTTSPTPTPTITPSPSVPVLTAITYTTAGSYTWEAPLGVSEATIEVWGAGGGGGNSNNFSANGGQGGGGGAYSKSVLTITGGTTYYLQVGLGGLGAPTASSNPALNGEPSWFNTTNNIPTSTNGVLANGGRLGLNNVDFSSFPNPPYFQIANGGTITDAFGDVKYSGGSGAYGSAFYGCGGGSSAGIAANGTDSVPTGVIEPQPGAIAPTGGGNGGTGSSSSILNGGPGFNPGGGGGGSDDRNTSAGGNGANGKVVIRYSIS